MPLARHDVGQLLADALRCTPARVAPLAQLVHDKTAGNPFFAMQFIAALADDGLLTFDHGQGCWLWDLDRIHAKRYTDNVVDLVVGKLHRLPVNTQEALQHLACLGNTAALSTLALVRGTSEEAVHADLSEAVRHEVIERLEGAYTFIHDRVQEAAYSLIPEERRAAAHLRIGRLLAARTPAEDIEEKIFEIVNQLNPGAALITSPEERERVAELNLIAGRRAKRSTAFAAAMKFLAAGDGLLPDDRWQRRYDLAFALEINRAECEFLTGELEAADARLSALSRRAGPLTDLAAVTGLHVNLHTTLDRSDSAVDVCLEYLRHVGIHWSAHPSKDEVDQEVQRFWQQLGERSIEDLIDLPLLSDPGWRATIDVLTALLPAALFSDENQHWLVIAHIANLSLEHGNSDGGCVGYVYLAMMLGGRFGDYRTAFRFGQLGYDLMERRGLTGFEARVRLVFGALITPWTKHVRTGRPLVRRALDAASRSADLTFVSYCHLNLISNLLAAGDPLSESEREAETGLAFATKVRFGLVVDIITGQQRLIRTLRGLTPDFSSFNDGEFDEARFERHLEADPRLALATCWYWIRKLQARVFAGDYASAIDAAAKAEPLMWLSRAFFEEAEYHFYGALARAASYDAASAAARPQIVTALKGHYDQLAAWAESGPDNFENRRALVAAELARIEGREMDAEHWYEQAIDSARDHGFVHNEGIAHEVAARFYLARGLPTSGNAHLDQARACYALWGADGKVRQLDERYPHLRQAESARDARGTIESPVEHLELTTVLNVSQAVSGELALDKLVETLLRTAIEHAGAERGVLIEPRGEALWVRAEGRTTGSAIPIVLRDVPFDGAALPESVVRYAARVHEPVNLDDASTHGEFSNDEYIRREHVKSVLCLPLLQQGRLMAVLYLENNLAAGVFTPARRAVLNVLAAQAAMSLEKSRLFHELQQREAKIRRLVEANIIGIFTYDLNGPIIEANDAFLRMVGYDRDDLVAGRLCWTDLTPPEWLERDQRMHVPQLETFGVIQPFEKEYFRKDGSRVPVLLGAANFGDQVGEGVAFVLDLTERKRAEQESKRLRQLEADLAHINRVSMMGELAASIAHEVNQPLTGIVSNGSACLRWLAGDAPDVDEVREAVRDIVRDGKRAGEVIARIRALTKRTAPPREKLDLNQTIREVLALVADEAKRNSVTIRTLCADDVFPVFGDRVQLQQVMLNLVMNAIEAMSSVSERARQLVITTRNIDADHVQVTVQDSGTGLDPNTLGRIFDAFYTTKPGGMGMGLSISRSILQSHGGRLWATSNDGPGATLHFTLPKYQPVVSDAVFAVGSPGSDESAT